ncbi:NmrA family NAD(P)-binding protein [Chitinophaga nivalis]|uniref:NmrA family NAD(P)-binding protein n=1 Tax=Chitinophaga nivalis TaxID=2991709 RepID=A0ABT3ISD7_9BACT|nr:NmrA family NAD(P)-binding protein [Chitinophaga nivalis]MCW3463465.1 NmrA family NAD(P)-binding protein [Chitinophaga nivalis]MCW3486845.1 NmrA family NAD(P)-binding protein [Chitinophaga nivalis]
MKIVLTGSLGNISKPLTKILTGEGHQVTLISSDASKIPQIEALGAQPAIGKIQDLPFLIQTFKEADVVYCMNPLDFTASELTAWSGYTDNYIQAIRETGVKRAVVLTGWIANCLKSVEPEKEWKTLTDVAITFMRPGVFYSNFYILKDMIRQQGVIHSNYGGDDMIAFVAPEDIAAAIAEEINTPVATGTKIRYVASEELTCTQAAQIIGEAIGKPDLQWEIIPGEQLKQDLEAAGMTDVFASLLVEMHENMHNGNAQKDYYLNRPVLGKTKLRDFAKTFATWYHQN